MDNSKFPGITERIKSIYYDLFSLGVLIILIGQLPFINDDLPFWLRISFFVFIFFLYEPLCVSFFGGSIGHFAVGIRVKRNSDHSRNIPIYMSVLRYAVKIFLGVISFISIQNSNKNKAIHDIVADSVVIYKQQN